MEGSQSEQPEPDATAKPRRISRKKERVITVAVVIVVIAILVAFWGSQSSHTYFPADIVNSPGQFVGRTVQVRGLAVAVNETNLTFVLTDYNKNLTVHYTSLPQGFQLKEEMIVKGSVHMQQNGSWAFVAQEVLVGHPK